MRKLGHYKKLIACLIGIGVLIANTHFGLGLAEEEVSKAIDVMVDATIGLLTSLGVYKALNR